MPHAITEAQLRSLVAKKLGIRQVDQRHWSAAHLYVRTALEEEEPDEEERAALIRDLCKEILWRMSEGEQDAAGHQEMPKQTSVGPVIPPHVMRRSRAFSDYVGVLATDHDGVRSFRALLGGNPLNPGQAGDFLRSEAFRYCSHKFLKEHNIPLIGHRSRVLTRSLPKRSADGRQNSALLKLEWDTHAIRVPIPGDADQAFQEELYERLEILGHRGRILRGSVFDNLRVASADVARSYGWDEPDATWFILTGHAPHMPAIAAETRGRATERHMHRRITLTIESWVSSRNVQRVYEHVQDKFRRGQSHGISPRNLELLTFVARRSSEASLSWRQLMTEWNRKFPKWRCDDPRNFRKDYMRTQLIVAFSG